MDITDKINLIKNSPTEEIVTESELFDLLNKENHPKHYIEARKNMCVIKIW